MIGLAINVRPGICRDLVEVAVKDGSPYGDRARFARSRSRRDWLRYGFRGASGAGQSRDGAQ